jgi:carboxymethylenebutenolidase
MSAPTAQDFDPQVMRLFDRYVHGDIDRRAFLAGAARYAVGGTTAAALLAALSPQFALAQQVPVDDARVMSSYVEFDSPHGNGRARGYLAQPAAAQGPAPTVLVVHENRGLNPYIEDVARRLAVAGYIALAPDALFPLGGYPGDEDAARALFPQLDQTRTRQDFIAAAHWLQAIDGGNGKLGVVGFCWGGAMVNHLATQLPGLAAAAPYYGGAAALDQVTAIKAELLVVLAADDGRVNAQWPDYQAVLTAAGVHHQLFQPAGTVHGFHNDTTPRFAPQAAARAWEMTLALFARTLR